jgi:anti-anti-sigma factor
VESASLGSVAVQVVDGVTVAVLRGEHDLATAAMLDDVLMEACARGPVIADLTDVAFVDSSVIAALIRHGGLQSSSLALVVPPEGVVATTLRLLAVDQVVPMFQQVSCAIAALKTSTCPSRPLTGRPRHRALPPGLEPRADLF